MTRTTVQRHESRVGGGVTYWIPRTGGDLHVVDMLADPHMDRVDMFTRDRLAMQVDCHDGFWVVVVDTALSLCEHPAMFATGSPHPSQGRDAYIAWLDSTRACPTCGTSVAMRDL